MRWRPAVTMAMRLRDTQVRRKVQDAADGQLKDFLEATFLVKLVQAHEVKLPQRA